MLALRRITLLLVFIFSSGYLLAQTVGDYRTNANTAWGTLATWQRFNGIGWVVPTAGEGYPGQFGVPGLVTIRNFNSITLNVSPANNIGALTIEAGDQLSNITFTGTNSLVVNGAVTINSGTGAGDNKTIAVGAGALSCASIAMVVTNNNNRSNSLTISTGTVTVAGNITMDDTAARNIIRITNTGNLNIGGNFLGITGGTLITVAGSTVNYNGANQTVKSFSYTGNLTLSGSGTKDLTNVTTIGGNFTMSGSSIAVVAVSAFIGGTVTLESGTTFTAGSFTIDVGGDWINNGATVDNTGSLINFFGTDASIGGSNSTIFNDVSFTGTGTMTLALETFINGDLSIDAGVVADLGTVITHTANTLTLGGVSQASGTWGSSSSAATNIDDTFFAATSGILNVASATFYSIANGNWNTNTTWSFASGGAPVGAGIFPVAGDIVNIEGGNTVTITSNAACATLNFENAGPANNLNINSAITLDVSGVITIPRAGNPNLNTLAVGAGILNAGSIAFTNGGGGVRHRITISTGTVSVTGDITTDNAGASASIIFTGGGTLNAGVGILTTTINGGTLTTFAGSTINYNGAAQTVKAINYLGNLTLSGTGIKTLQAGTTSIGGNFSISGSATTTAVVALTIGGIVTLESGTSFTAGAFTHNVGGNWVNNGGAFVNTGSTINFGAGSQNIGGSNSTTFNNLSLTVSGTKTFGIATFMDGNLSISGTAVANLGTITTHTANGLLLGGANQASGAWGSTSSAAIHTNNTYFAATTGIVTIAAAQFYSIATGNWNANTTWSFSLGGPAVSAGIFPTASDIVNITGGFTVTVNVNSACSVINFQNNGAANNLNINPATTLDVSGLITIPRTAPPTNATNLNTLAVGAGTLNAGSVAFTNGGGGVRHQITISTGTATVTGDITTDNAGVGASIIFSGAGTLNAGVGILTTTINGGTLTTFAGSTINYNGAAQTVRAINYLGNLTLSGTGAKTLQAGTTSVGGNFSISGSATTTAVAALTIGGIVTLESGTSFTAGAFTHNVGGNWVNNGGTFVNTGSTINFGAGSQNIGGSSSTTFNNLTLAVSGTKTFGIATFMDGNLSISGTAVANLGTITTHTADALILGGVNQPSGTWGSTASVAANTNNTYFAASTGIVTIAAAQFYTIATGNWNTNTTWSLSPGGPAVGAGIFPAASDIVNITGGFSVTVTADAACASLSFIQGANSNTVTINPTINLVVAGTITIPRGTAGGNNNTLAVGAGNLNAGNIAFTNGGGGQRHFLTISTGTAVVTGNVTQVASTGSATITFTGTGLLQVGGTFLTAATGTLTTFAGSTVTYNGALAQTIGDFNYSNLTLSGGGIKTLQVATTSIGGNLTLSGTASATTVVGLAISGNLNIGDGTAFSVAGFPLTVTGTTTVGGGTTGQLSISASAGLKIFTGLVTIASGGTWTNNTANSPVSFRGGITNNGTFLAGTGIHTFDTNSQQLTGTFSIPSVTVTGITLTNNNSLTTGTALSGTGDLTQASNAVLNLGGTSGITTLTASNSGNTVNYNGSTNQLIKGPVGAQYANLSFNGTTASGIAIQTLSSTLSVSGNWVNNGTGTFSTATGYNPNGGTIIFNGSSTISGSSITSFSNLQLGASSTLNLPAGDVNVFGNIDLSATGTFSPSTGRVVINGSALQAVSPNGKSFYTIQVNKGGGSFDINSSLPVQHLLDIQSATVVNSNNNLLILSTGISTANDGAIGPVATGASVNGNVTVQRYMDAIGNTFRYLGAPVTSVLPPALWGSTIYEYIYTAGSGAYAAHSTSSPLTLGTGYTIGLNMSSPITWSVSAPVITGDYTWNFPEEGWHLVGNPYASAIRWFNSPGVSWDLTNIATTIAVTDNAVTGYPNYFRYFSFNPINDPTTWGTGPLINGMVAMGQAFWVYAGTGGGSLTIHEQAKENSLSGEFYRTQSTDDSNILKVTLDNGKYADVAYLKLNSHATNGYEFRYDLKKLRNPDMNIFLSDQSNNELVINAIDKIETGNRIPVGVEVIETGEYSLSFESLQNFQYAGTLYLIDTYEGKAMPISSGKYTFQVNESLQSHLNRFYLSLENIVPERSLVETIEAYPNPVQDKLTIRVPSREKVSIQMMDNQGREILSEQIKGSYEINMVDYPRGMYLLRLFTNDEVVIRKIIR